MNIDRIVKKSSKHTDLVPLSDRLANDGDILVSVHCLVFNQEKYIARCLDSILEQKTNFNVEIIVHDDFSSDKSREIIESYKSKFPHIIKTVYEQKNIYSETGNFIEIAGLLNNISQGKYIAICEGDDYWTDPCKLMIQFSLLEQNDDSHFCVHRVNVVSSNNGSVPETSLPSFKLRSKKLSEKRFIEIISRKYNFQTSSYFFRKADYDLFFKNRPDFSRIMPTDDEILIRFFGTLGGTIYVDRAMSTYVQFTSGSWSEKNKQDKEEKELQRFLKAVDMFDSYSNYRFHKFCEDIHLRKSVYALLAKKEYGKIFKDKKLRHMLKTMDYRTYISLLIKRTLRRI